MDIQFDYNYKNHIEEIKSLYLEAFPSYERKSFEQIKKVIEIKKCQIISILDKSKFVGFLILLKDEDITLIDYFAIKKEYRAQGIGKKSLLKLNQGNPIIIEIEPVNDKCQNKQERMKRKLFYQALGFKSSNVIIKWYNTKLELMSLNDKNPIKNYFCLLDNIFTKKERVKNINILKQ